MDLIIDYLHDDRKTLQSCSVLCRALVASARYHLFETVVVNRRNFKKAKSILVRKAPHLLASVRSLTLEGLNDPQEKTVDRLRDLQDGKDLRPLTHTFIHDIAPRAVNVSHLGMKDVPLNGAVVAALAAALPHVHTLTIFDCWFRSNADFDRLVRSHPLVHTVRVGRLSSLYGMTPPGQELPIGPPLLLPSLKISEAYSPSPCTMMPWLAGHADPEHFTYTLYRVSQIPTLNNSIFAMPALQHLHLVYYRWRYNAADLEEVQDAPAMLGLAPRAPATITTLTLDGKLESLLLVVYTLALLDVHGFAALRTINVLVHVVAEDVANLAPHVWAAVDCALVALPALAAVRFANTCKDTAHVAAGRRAIVQRLPALRARKILTGLWALVLGRAVVLGRLVFLRTCRGIEG
ncbi:uncharacterized protein BXZ73DRAFT_92673 [Epithele typhae]|uniref:uncharacterized protein n=1 Tax=Epithele typhae TaxID=378194 RepID=UPI00200835BA|nr:uncharacterized protein BXZ73DRAFT_92673 [Epithele typhae]KAH9915170.1 hypothetical protein BXZ73DRAFT_92673 [Epithele typhae]